MIGGKTITSQRPPNDVVSDEHIAATAETLERTRDLRRRLLSGVVTPYDHLFTADDPQVQYYLDLVKIRIALSSGSMPLKDAFKAVNLLFEDPEAIIAGTFGPLPEAWSQEMIDRLIENVTHLKKLKVMKARLLYSAFIDSLTFQRPHVPPTGWDAEVFAYFARNPLSTFSAAARNLGKSRPTVRSAYSRLEKQSRIMPLGLLTGCAFGITTLALYFELENEEDWQSFREGLLEFPFTKTIHKSVTNPFGYVSFSIPDKEENINRLRTDIKQLSRAFLRYSSVHRVGTYHRFMNPDLMHGNSWKLPECLITRKLTPPRVFNGAHAFVRGGGYVEGLKYEDFIVSEIVAYHLRRTPLELQSIMSKMGHKFNAGQIAYRRDKALEWGVMSPWLWFGQVGLHYSFNIEIVCTNEWRKRIVGVISGFPEAFLVDSDRGVAVILEAPSYHLAEYFRFLSQLNEQTGVESVRPILTMNRSGGRDFIEIFGKREFGKAGFSDSRFDESLSRYIL